MTSKRAQWITVGLLCAATSGIAGCPVRDRRNPDNGNDMLSEDVQQAIDDVLTQFAPVAEALAAFFDGFEGIEFDGDGMFGECPIVTVAEIDGVYSITMDYGDGCTNEYYGTDPASGSVSLEFDSNTRSFVLDYDSLAIEDREIDGSLTLDFTRDDDARNLDGTIDLTTNSGSVIGTLDVRYGLLTNTITINEAVLAMTDSAGETVSLAIDGLVIRPIANESFIPQAGTITFDVPSDGPGADTLTVVVRYTTQSPDTREVSVTVGNAPPVTYTIPSF